MTADSFHRESWSPSTRACGQTGTEPVGSRGESGTPSGWWGTLRSCPARLRRGKALELCFSESARLRPHSLQVAEPIVSPRSGSMALPSWVTGPRAPGATASSGAPPAPGLSFLQIALCDKEQSLLCLLPFPCSCVRPGELGLKVSVWGHPRGHPVSHIYTGSLKSGPGAARVCQAAEGRALVFICKSESNTRTPRDSKSRSPRSPPARPAAGATAGAVTLTQTKPKPREGTEADRDVLGLFPAIRLWAPSGPGPVVVGSCTYPNRSGVLFTESGFTCQRQQVALPLLLRI